MGFAITTDQLGFRVGSYGCQDYLAGAILTGYALEKRIGWQRVAARWVTPDHAGLVHAGGQLPYLHIEQGKRLLAALEEWAKVDDQGGSVLIASHSSINLGRKMKPAAGDLATLLVAYDGICAPGLDRDWTPAEAAQVGPLLASIAVTLAAIGYPGGWADEVQNAAQVCLTAVQAGTVVRLG